MEYGSDEELIARFLAGSDAAFEVIARRYEVSLVRFLMRYVGRKEAAEEIYQETFIRVYRKAASFEQGRKFKTWLYTIGLNLARTEMAKLRNRPKMARLDSTPGGDDRSTSLGSAIPSDEMPPVEQVAQKEIGIIIRKAVEELSDRHKEVFILYQYDNLSYEEISETLGRPLGTIKSQMHYALKDLRAKLERLGIE